MASNRSNLGHTSLVWRFCEDREAFEAAQPVIVLRFLLRIWKEALIAREARTCAMLRKASEVLAWPSCDLNISLPAMRESLPAWPPFRKVGVPFEESTKFELLEQSIPVGAFFSKPELLELHLPDSSWLCF